MLFLDLIRGEAVTEADALIFSNLAYFAVTVLDRDLRELRRRGLVAHVRARSAWPHPLRRSTDRVVPLPLRHLS